MYLQLKEESWSADCRRIPDSDPLDWDSSHKLSSQTLQFERTNVCNDDDTMMVFSWQDRVYRWYNTNTEVELAMEKYGSAYR